MKNTKKFAAMIAALTLSACSIAPMAMTASAVDLAMSSPSLPENASIEETVKAYKVFNITVTGSTADDDRFMSVEGWGDGVNQSALVEAIQDDEVFKVQDENVFAGIDVSNENSASKVAEALAKLSDEQVEAFAKYVINNKAGDGVDGTYESGNVNFETLADGYYAISCTVKGEVDTDTSQSLGMLTVVDNEATEVGKGEAKVGLPQVMKKVKEDGHNLTLENAGQAEIAGNKETDIVGGIWNDVADYDIGDAVPFKLYGTMPSNLNMYKAYYYEFEDTLGTQFDMPTSMTIKVGNTTLTATSSEGVWSVAGDTGTNCRVKVDGQVISISFEDIKAYTGVDEDTLVTVEYEAVLNKTAKIGKPGQENKVSLNYSNNPNFKYTPNTDDDNPDTPDEEEKSKSKEDKVKVFVYALEVEKKFFNGSSPLTVEEIEEDTFGAVTFNLTKDGETLKFKKLEVGDDGYGTYDYVVDAENGTADLKLTEVGGADGDLSTKADNKLVVRIKGLDDGTYTLSEVEYPTEYNQAPDQTIVIKAKTVNDQTWNGTDADETLEEFKYVVAGDEKTGDTEDTLAKAQVDNKKGLNLPSTGGIGTTIFYLGGGAMVAVAGVFLITKKRMGKEEN